MPPLSKSISNVIKQYGSTQQIQSHKKSQSQVGNKQQSFLNSLSIAADHAQYQSSSPQLPINNNS